MPAAEIKALRQAGKLDEALAMAQEELNANPENIWGKRNISWVYYEYLKKYADTTDFELFKETLIKIQELKLQEDEKILYDNSAWQVGKMVFHLNSQNNIDYNQIYELFLIIKEFHFTKLSDAYSFLLKAFQKAFKEKKNEGFNASAFENNSRYRELIQWWGLEHFQEKDYQPEEFNNRKIMSLVEQVIISYSKTILIGDQNLSIRERIEGQSENNLVNPDQVDEFMPFLDQVIKNHGEYQYPLYFKAKLLEAIGKNQEAITFLIPFVKKKKRDFWTWELLGELHGIDSDEHFACLCKALSLKTQDKFLIGARETFANILIEKAMFDEAKTEIEEIVRVRTKNEWKISNSIQSLTQAQWYPNATARKNNRDLYKQYEGLAEDILYHNHPEETVIVEFVNESKKMLNFVKSQNFNGFFKYEGLLESPNVGDVIKIRYADQGDKNDNYFQVFTAKNISDKESLKNLEAHKSDYGNINIPNGKNFGFVNGVFIPDYLITKHNLTDEQSVKFQALLSYNKQKKEWSYRCYDLKVLN